MADAAKRVDRVERGDVGEGFELAAIEGWAEEVRSLARWAAGRDGVVLATPAFREAEEFLAQARAFARDLDWRELSSRELRALDHLAREVTDAFFGLHLLAARVHGHHRASGIEHPASIPRAPAP